MELKSSKITSQKYHDIFDYKLTEEEAVRWQYKNQKTIVSGIKNKSRLQREKYSKDKLLIAKKASNLIAKIPTVKFIGITGALAMNNADFDSDIDLLIITKGNMLWITRLLVYIELKFSRAIKINNYELRNPSNKKEKDKLCLNMWLDENDLIWNKKDRNIYTAHEIAQIIPLVNESKTYEKFLYLNRWVLNFWPNAVKFNKELRTRNYGKKQNIFNMMAYKIQYFYMKNKITREVVTPTRAIFHPNDWGKVIMKKLSS